MEIDEKLFTKLERLSQIKIQDDKRTEVKEQFEQMLTFVNMLDEISLKTKDVDVTSHQATPFREDLPIKSDVNTLVFKHAPKVEDSFFIVPKIIE